MLHWRKELLLLFLGVLVMVIFEASQQYYYILQFNLADPSEVSFFDVLEGQAYRWLFWILFAIPLVLFISKNPVGKSTFTLKIASRYLIVISLLLLFTIAAISVFQLFMSKEVFNVSNLTEYFIFYTFQKSPIYFIAFIGLVIVVHFMLSTEAMELKMKELSAIKEKQAQLYEELKSKSYSDTSPLIEVKTGNRLKYVPLDSIYWIQADDYCVKLHDSDNQSHTIRTSLKALENQLPNTFIRVHRKAIVHLEYVKELILVDQPRIVLNNCIEVPIAQSRLKAVKKHLSNSFILNPA